MELIPNKTYVKVHETENLDSKKEYICNALFVGFGVINGKTGAVVMFKTPVGKIMTESRSTHVLRCYELERIEVE